MLSARKKNTSESVDPSIRGYRLGSTARTSSRLTRENSPMSPLCIQSQLPNRNGWQFVSCTGDPDDARMCANTRPELRCEASSRRLRSFHAGSTEWKVPGVSAAPYQPTPNPSPFVVSAPIVEWRLWSMSECFGSYRSCSRRTGDPE
jgi:hypothetical protein